MAPSRPPPTPIPRRREIASAAAPRRPRAVPMQSPDPQACRVPSSIPTRVFGATPSVKKPARRHSRYPTCAIEKNCFSKTDMRSRQNISRKMFFSGYPAPNRALELITVYLSRDPARLSGSATARQSCAPGGCIILFTSQREQSRDGPGCTAAGTSIGATARSGSPTIVELLSDDFKFTAHLPDDIDGDSRPRSRAETAMMVHKFMEQYDILAFDPGPIIVDRRRRLGAGRCEIPPQEVRQGSRDALHPRLARRRRQGAELEQRHDLEQLQGLPDSVEDGAA